MTEKTVTFGGVIDETTITTERCDRDITTAKDSAIPPSGFKRQTLQRTVGIRGPLCGIKNLGATCYMNSLLQSLFMTPELRNHIVSWPFDPKQRHAHNIAYQLQLLFAQMQHDKLPYVDAKALVDSFGMGPEAYRQQHDVQELNRKLLDVVQTFIDKANAPQILRRVYEGTFRDYKRCTTCKVETSSTSTFQDVSLVIDGIPTLEGALCAFTNPDFIDGIRCDHCEAPREVAKGLTYGKFPQIFTIQLLRMQYNLMNGKREKVHQDVKLPIHLDLTQYDPEAQFELQTVIAHRGTAYHGHYYAYTRVERVERSHNVDASAAHATAVDIGGRWIKFDDDTVTWADNDEIEEYIDPASWKQRAEHREAAAAIRPASENTPVAPITTAAPSLLDDDDDAAVANLFVDDGSSTVTRLKTVSGHSYYAVYRRCDLPWQGAELLQASNPIPDYVIDTNAETLKKFDADAAELDRLMHVIPVGIVFQGVKRWVDFTDTATVGDVLDEALRYFCSNGTPKFARVRAFSAAFGVLGRTYENPETLVSLGFGPADLKSYPVFGLEITDDVQVGESWKNQRITEWDTKTSVQCFDEASQSFVDVPDAGITGWKVECTFPASATLREALVAVAQHVAISNAAYADEKMEDLLFSVVRKSSAEVIDVDLETGIPRDMSTPWREIKATAEADRVLVERRKSRPTAVPSEISAPAVPWLLSAAYIATERKHQATVTAKYFGSVLPVATSEGGAPSEEAPVMDVTPEKEVIFTMDERRTLLDVKRSICERFDIDMSAVQMLIDGGRREPTALATTIRGSSFGTKKLAVAIVTGAPLPPDETYVEVYVATGSYTTPTEYFVKQHIKIPTTTVNDFIASIQMRPEASARGLAAIPPGCIRARLMPPNRTAALGAPLVKPVITENMTSHHVDELRVVLQVLDAPCTEPMTKSTLILNLHHWNSAATGSQSPLGPRHELVTAKDAPVSTLTARIAELLCLDGSATTDSDANALPAFEFARCRHFQLSDQKAAAKLPWGLIDVSPGSQDLTKHLGGFPLRFEQEDIVVFRRPTDPWPEGIVQQFGEIVGGRTVTSKKRKGEAAKSGGPKKEASAKAHRDEPGIHLHAVWEMEQPSDIPDAVDAPPAECDAPKPASSSGGVPIDFIPCCDYNKSEHASIEESCSVCMGEFEEKEVVCVLQCYHIFHRECLAPWTELHGTCPKCLQSVF